MQNYDTHNGYKRTDVRVNLDWDIEGNMIPRQIHWYDGRIFDLNVISACHRPAAKVGGVGIRYTVMVSYRGKRLKTTHLYFEDGADPEVWFVEESVPYDD